MQKAHNLSQAKIVWRINTLYVSQLISLGKKLRSNFKLERGKDVHCTVKAVIVFGMQVNVT